jgi:hypothetical protein
MLAGLLGLKPLFEGVIEVIKRVVPDKTKQDEIQREIELFAKTVEAQAQMAQVGTNDKEALHTSVFVAGWRPWIGWTCGIAFSVHAIVIPLILFLIAIIKGLPIPAFDPALFMQVMLGMLGLGAYRTLEKVSDKIIASKEKIANSKYGTNSPHYKP